MMSEQDMQAWSEMLREKYGIAKPIDETPEDGIDE